MKTADIVSKDFSLSLHTLFSQKYPVEVAYKVLALKKFLEDNFNNVEFELPEEIKLEPKEILDSSCRFSAYDLMVFENFFRQT